MNNDFIVSPVPMQAGYEAPARTIGLSQKTSLRHLILLTQIPRPNYSGGMISEFHQLPDKIRQLAALTDSLRQENAELRRAIAALSTENADLSSRIDEAHRRVSSLLDKLPEASDQNQETA